MDELEVFTDNASRSPPFLRVTRLRVTIVACTFCPSISNMAISLPAYDLLVKSINNFAISKL